MGLFTNRVGLQEKNALEGELPEMNIHKRTNLTPLQRKEMYLRHQSEYVIFASLAEEYHVAVL